MIKDIVANLSLRDSPDVAMDFAVSVAVAFNARLAGIAFVYEPIIPVMIDMYGIPPDVIESQRVENERAAKAAVARLDKAARTQALPRKRICLMRPLRRLPEVFASLARRFDLSILGQPEPEQPALDRLIVEAALFDSGRPMLVVPYIQRNGLKLDRILLCWDGSRSAARAAADALPFLRRASWSKLSPSRASRPRAMKCPAPTSPTIWRVMALRWNSSASLPRRPTSPPPSSRTRRTVQPISWSWAATVIRGCGSSSWGV